MPGSRSSSALTMLLLPPPDGAATTKRQPAAPGLCVVMVMGPPTLAAWPLRGPRRGRNSQLGAALRCSWAPPCLRLRRCAAPAGGAIRSLGRPCAAHVYCLFQILDLLAHLLDQ